MSIYTISDLHLPFGVNKPMNIFGKAWENYTKKLLENWQNTVGENDTVVIPGDLSWATYLEQSVEDFKFINNLNGTKIILKGNHDYYYTTLTKMNVFFNENHFSTIKILHNNFFKVADTLICGTRGWDILGKKEEDEKLVDREAIRLEISIEKAIKEYPENDIHVFLHYPPIYKHTQNSKNKILDVLEKYHIKKCYYGHLHAKGINNAFIGEHNNVNFSLVSSDYLQFLPQIVKECNIME